MSSRPSAASTAPDMAAAKARRSVPYVDLAAQYREEREELLPLIDQVLSKGNYIGGEPVDTFEAGMAAFLGVRHAIGLNSGTDALVLGMLALGIGVGDEVITPPNSFVASTSAIVHVGATPVFVDVLPDQNIDPELIEAAITPRTKAIMPVHLTGRVAAMTDIMRIAEKHGLSVIEDAAQAIGSKYDGKLAGAIGTIGCFSTHPLKNLNACGDGGILTTDRDDVARAVRLLRNHGLVDRNTVTRAGFVSRMDTLQATILGYRLGRLPEITARRRANAAVYMEHLDLNRVFVPPEQNREFNTYHTFVIQTDRRDELQAYLLDRGVGTAIHYPIPIHRQPAFAAMRLGPGSFPNTERQAERILTLPVNQSLGKDDIIYVADCVREFF